MRRAIIYLVIFIVLLIAPTAVRHFSFYELSAPDVPEPPDYIEAQVEAVDIPPASDFVDNPEVGEGFVLLDQAHGNNFTLDEIGVLDGRLAARGHELIPFISGDLTAALRSVKAFIVIAPQEHFSRNEVLAVADFVDRGGRLLLVGDPTRFTVSIEEDLFSFTFSIDSDKLPLNSLGNEFDIIFNDDYLYNTSDNEGNFRNILLNGSSLGESDFTDGLEQVAFYGSHSLQVGANGRAVLTGDDNTWSSDTDRPGDLILAATGSDGRVLALGDIHFLTEPYYTVYDNSQFIARMADFLTAPTREYVLADFPYFYGDDISLIYTGAPDLGPDAFDEIITLQEAFRAADRNLSLKASSSDEDSLYLGLYNQTDEVIDILVSNGISLTIQPPILTKAEMLALDEEDSDDDEEDVDPEDEADTGDEDEADTRDEEEVEEPDFLRLIRSELGNVQMSGTALILLQEEGDHHKVIVLAASNEGLESAIGRLLDLTPINANYALADCLLQGNLALCPTNVSGEEIEAELETGGASDTAVDEEEETSPPDEEENPEETSDIDGALQGSIALGESVEGVMAEDEAHLWTFSDGPATIDIIVESGEELDAVLELYGPDNEFIDASDSGFTGDNEQILGIEIPDDGTYTIRVADFFVNGGDYTLTVAIADESSSSNNGGDGIFIFGDDSGIPLTDGFLSVDAIADILDDDYDVTVWISSEDGPLEEDTLEGYATIIWDSGDYRDEEGFFDDDTFIIFDFVDAGGSLVVVGASPSFFSLEELSPLTAVELTGDDPTLLDGFTSGDVWELDQPYETVSFDSLEPDLTGNEIIFMIRGPDDPDAGSTVALATIEEDLGDQRTVFMLVPFTALPADVQPGLLNNMINWING
jgi:hypothetical protein